jgi:hypothetical protein
MKNNKGKNVFKKLKKNYWSYDITDFLFTSNFEFFCDFMENGELQIVDWEYDELHKKVKKELDDLYHWYKVDRENYNKEYDKLEVTIDDLTFNDFKNLVLNISNIKKVDKNILNNIDRTNLNWMKVDMIIRYVDSIKLNKLISLRDWLWI